MTEDTQELLPSGRGPMEAHVQKVEAGLQAARERRAAKEAQRAATQQEPPRPAGGGIMEAAVRTAEERQRAAKERQARETQEATEVRATRLKGKEEPDKAADLLIQSKKTTQELRRSGVKPSGTTPRDYLQSLSTRSAVKQTIEGLKGK